MKKGLPKQAAGMGGGFSKAQQDMAMGQFTGLIDNVLKLQAGQTEKKDFPFGVLKVKRL
jgi:hypothetical protein